MKRTGFVLALIFTIFFITKGLSAQDQIQAKRPQKKTLTFNPARLILNEVRFGYELQLSERHALRASLGYQYPTSKDSYGDLNMFLYRTPFYYTVSKGVYLGAGYNYVLGVGSRIYISPELYFCSNNFDRKYYHHSSGSNHEAYLSLESMKLRKTGLKILFGRKVRIFEGNKMGFEIDYFAGLGLQYRHEETTTFAWHGGSSSWPYSTLIKRDPPEISTERTWNETLNLGILISVHFY
jgi:hypothetical protein